MTSKIENVPPDEPLILCAGCNKQAKHNHKKRNNLLTRIIQNSLEKTVVHIERNELLVRDDEVAVNHVAATCDRLLSVTRHHNRCQKNSDTTHPIQYSVFGIRCLLGLFCCRGCCAGG